MEPDSPPLDAEALLAQLPFARGLARELLRDEAEADDVAQDAALAGLRQPAPRVGWRPWLVGTTRRLAALVRRRDSRRWRHEQRAASPEARPSALDESARLEALARVVAALERLPAADQSLLMRRYHDGWPPRRIAAALEIPVNTVRTRLARALERLRRELCGGSLQKTARALAPLLLPGAPLMSIQAKVASVAALLLTVVIGSELMRSGSSEPAPDAARASAAGAASASDAAAITAARMLADPAAAEPSATAAADSRGDAPALLVELRGQLVGTPDSLSRWSTPLALVGAVETLEDGMVALPPAPERLAQQILVAPDGSFTETIVVPSGTPRLARLTLRGEDPRFAPIERRLALPNAAADELPVRWDVAVPLFPRVSVSGRVVDAAGQPVAGAAVAWFERREPSTTITSVVEATCDSDGEFTAGLPSPGPYWWVATPRRVGREYDLLSRAPIDRAELAPTVAAVEIAPITGARDDQELGDLVLREGVAIRGVVERYGFGPAADAVVRARPLQVEPALIGTRTRTIVLPDCRLGNAMAVCDARGAFAIEGLAPGEWTIELVDCEDGNLPSDFAEATRRIVTAPADDVRLSVEAVAVEFVCRSRGVPLERARVRVATPRCGTIAFRRGRFDCDPDGRTGIVLPPGLRVHWSANAAEHAAAGGEFTTTAAGTRIEIPIELEPLQRRPALRLRVTGPAGESITRCGVRLERDDPEAPLAELDLLADATGEFVVADLAPGPDRLRLRPGGAWSAGLGCFAETVRSIEIKVESVAELDVVAVRAARLRVSARAADGRYLAAGFALLGPDGAPVSATPLFVTESERGAWIGSRFSSDGLSDEGPCLIDEPLAPGNYRATFRCAGYAERMESLTLEAGRCAELEVVLEPLSGDD